MSNHTVVVLLVTVIIVCVLLLVLLAYAEWTGVGKTKAEMNERQSRRYFPDDET